VRAKANVLKVSKGQEETRKDAFLST